eukprot:scaffold1439_cov179-Ochromonas_danica.AAC.7
MSFQKVSHEKTYLDLAKKLEDEARYNAELIKYMKANDLDIPPRPEPVKLTSTEKATLHTVMQKGSIEEIQASLEQAQKVARLPDISIEFHDLCFTTSVPVKREIPSTGQLLKDLFCFWKKTEMKEVAILSHLTGRILPRKMTLLMGPPGSGKSCELPYSAEMTFAFSSLD